MKFFIDVRWLYLAEKRGGMIQKLQFPLAVWFG